MKIEERPKQKVGACGEVWCPCEQKIMRRGLRKRKMEASTVVVAIRLPRLQCLWYRRVP